MHIFTTVVVNTVYMHTVSNLRHVAIPVSSSKPPFWYKPLHLHSIYIFLAIFCTICASEIKEYISHHRRRGTRLQTVCNKMICDSQCLEILKTMLKLMHRYKLSSVLQIKNPPNNTFFNIIFCSDQFLCIKILESQVNSS